MKRPTLFILLGILTAIFVSAESVAVKPHQTLWSLSRQYGVSVNQLKEWNNLNSNTVFVGQRLKVSPDTETTVSAEANSSAFTGPANADLTPFRYIVHSGDSLLSLSQRWGTSLEELRRLNGLTDDTLMVGQRLYIRRPQGITFYTVESGDSLGHISVLFQISEHNLKAINQLASSQVVPGQILRVFKPAEVPLTHVVAPTDTLPGIAALYNTTPSALRALNGLSDDTVHPGEVLRLKNFASASTLAVFDDPSRNVSPQASPAGTYRVKLGDTLYKIARNQGLKVQDLETWNHLTDSRHLFVGQTLQLGPTAPVTATVASTELKDLPQAPGPVSFPGSDTNTTSNTTSDQPLLAEPTEVSLGAVPQDVPSPNAPLTPEASRLGHQYVVMDPNIPVFEWNGDYYYWTHPGALSQPNRGYFEDDWPSPLDAYQKAHQLWKKFAAMVNEEPPLSTKLKGWSVVLDPGHGGLDPGTIVRTPGPNGGSLYITEAQYVYDIAMRMYELLRRNGARVELTRLVPNRLILDTNSPDSTLINEKNSVYNSLADNQSDDNSDWPQGSVSSLDKRVDIARTFFQGTPENRRIFISLHADNNPGVPVGTGVYTFETRSGLKDQASLGFAEKLLPYLGKDSYTRAEPLIVLKNNPATYKILVETHNLAIPAQAWLMRFGKTREKDAERMVKGILEAVKS